MFNLKQQEAIAANNNVVIVIAGAGSGKTTVLVEKIKTEIESGVNPQNILAITFTNKAAIEMKERLIAKINAAGFGVTMVTFHALAVRIIRENIDYLKSHNYYFTILDSEDQKKIIKKIIKNLNSSVSPGEVIFDISQAKSRALTYDTVELLVSSEYSLIYQEYIKYCQENNAFDFDDLLLVTYHLLKIKEVRNKYNLLFKYIHVDEFQDTSIIQGEILKKIKSKENKLFIVGDIDQSIYTWRGATIDNLLNLADEYKDSKVIKLEQNYRSTQKILDAANKLIAFNKKRIEKNLWTENKSGRDIQYFITNTNIDEANTIIREINALADYGASYSEFAVLYRYNYQSRKIEELLVKNKIPYRIFGGISFYERMEIKDIVAYLRIIHNPNDTINLLRILNVPKRKVGDKTITKFENYANENNKTLFETIQEIGGKNLQKFLHIIKKYKILFETKSGKEFSKFFDLFLTELDYANYLHTLDDQNKVEERLNNIRELKEGLIQELELGKDIIEYMMDISVTRDSKEKINTNDKVILSTIHGVKGLEFDNVFITGMINGKFPKEQAFDDIEEMEEERRLAYVAMTRAKYNLTLLGYRYDFKYELQKPSLFLEEIGLETKETLEDTIDDGFIF